MVKSLKPCPWCHEATENQRIDLELSCVGMSGIPDEMNIYLEVDEGICSDLCIDVDLEVLGRAVTGRFRTPVNFCPICGRDLRGDECLMV